MSLPAWEIFLWVALYLFLIVAGFFVGYSLIITYRAIRHARQQARAYELVRMGNQHDSAVMPLPHLATQAQGLGGQDTGTSETPRPETSGQEVPTITVGGESSQPRAPKHHA